MNLSKLHNELKTDHIYEFYFMHYYYTLAGDLFFPSYRKFLDDLTPEQQIGPAAFIYFLDGMTDERHEQVIDNIQKFID
jgi:hypothetical protein